MSLPAITVAYPDALQWDHFCDTHEHGHLLQKSNWGMLKRTTGWDDVRIAVYDDDELRAGAQVLTQRRYGLALCYVPRGPLLCDDQLINHALIAAITAYAKRQRAIAVRYEPNIVHDDRDAPTYIRALAITNAQTMSTMQPQHTIWTALNGDDEQLFKRMTKGHRADIKRAQRDGVTIRTGERASDLDTFVAIMQYTGQRNGFAVHQRA
ncbi:MAG: lipid II:glycine glycyltransferase FemX, partial [Roseiflexaceae bacterium]